MTDYAFNALRSNRICLFTIASITLMSTLGACATKVISSETLHNSEPAVWWADQYSLPLMVHGVAPGIPLAKVVDLAHRTDPSNPQARSKLSMLDQNGRVIMYINLAKLPPDEELCSGAPHATSIDPIGRDMDVTVALCDDTRTLTAVHGVVTADASESELRDGLATLQSALFWDLYRTQSPP